jgi:hypothetical protein
MSLARKRTLASLVAVLAVIAGCAPDGQSSRSASLLDLRDLELKVVEAPVDGTTIPCPVEEALVLAMAGFRPEADLERPVLRIIAGCGPDNTGQVPMVHVIVNLEVANPTGTTEWLEWTDTEPFDTPESSGIAEAARVFARSLEGLDGQRRIREIPDAGLVDIIEGRVPVSRPVLLVAIEETGERRLRGAAGTLLKALDTDDEMQVLRVIGALGRLEDPIAIPALGRLGVAGPLVIVFPALQAIADIDGPEARRALELVANQTTDLRIAREARQLLSRLTTGDRE